jgi:hypothetical protein
MVTETTRTAYRVMSMAKSSPPLSKQSPTHLNPPSAFGTSQLGRFGLFTPSNYHTTIIIIIIHHNNTSA